MMAAGPPAGAPVLRSGNVNWDSIHDLMALRERRARRTTSPEAGWAPPVDLLETEVAFVLVVELPGLGPDDFAISATQDGLVLSGSRPAPVPVPERYLRLERGQGRFTRTFSFGQAINTDRINAGFDRGLLTITVPKATSRAERRIPIS